MKLLNYTASYLAFILLAVITVWAVAFYYAMLDEIYDSLDDGLENQKVLLIKRAYEDPSILTQETDFNKHVYDFSSISKARFVHLEEQYRDTLMYRLNEEEFEPVRIYESPVHINNHYYKLKIITSMVEEDDLVQHLVLYLIALYGTLVVCVLILNNVALRKIWRPFHKLIDQLATFKIEQKQNIQTHHTHIDEFQLLNTTITQLINSSRNTFIEQKQFIENASHELQTPLAISINKLELFIEQFELNDEQLVALAAILDSLGNMTRLNNSLLLLSKIDNRQFVEESNISMNQLLIRLIQDFEDLATHRAVSVQLLEHNRLEYSMNKDLALILLTNLIKNAIIHSPRTETVIIAVNVTGITIQNAGINQPLDPEILFSRFKKTSNSKQSTGLGLAIAKTIAAKYGIVLQYQYDEAHIFSLHFPTIPKP